MTLYQRLRLFTYGTMARYCIGAFDDCFAKGQFRRAGRWLARAEFWSSVLNSTRKVDP